MAIRTVLELGRRDDGGAGRMTGDINYEILELHEGAEFEGSMRRTGGSASKPVTSAGMAPDEPQQPVHASPG